MALPTATKKLINKVVAERKPLLIIGGTDDERLALARQIHRSFPPLTKTEKSELAAIYKAAGIEPINARPFRAPHHTISEAGLCGGRTKQMPGEVALAHAGVLFLDDVTEFKGKALTRLGKIIANADQGANPLLIAGGEKGCQDEDKVMRVDFAGIVEL
jgi:magnesium chelatase family protein